LYCSTQKRYKLAEGNDNLFTAEIKPKEGCKATFKNAEAIFGSSCRERKRYPEAG